MSGNEKYKNPDIKDGKPIISKNLVVVFYYKEPPKSFTGILDHLSRISKIVLGMSTTENPPEEIARTIAYVANNNSDILYFVPIVYNSLDEKKSVIDILEKLGFKNELFENQRK